MKENEYNGTPLGQSVKETWSLTEIKVGHPERDTPKAILFDEGWVPCSLIQKITWKNRCVDTITIPTWFAKKEGF